MRGDSPKKSLKKKGGSSSNKFNKSPDGKSKEGEDSIEDEDKFNIKQDNSDEIDPNVKVVRDDLAFLDRFVIKKD